MQELIKKGEWIWVKGQYPNGFFLQTVVTEEQQNEIVDFLNNIPSQRMKWSGDAHAANILFGENYGVDWSY